MKHKMKLLKNPFDKMLNDIKDIEFRLYDDKRKKLKIGDTIEFCKLPDLTEKLEVEVIELYQYPTFRELLVFLGYEDKDLNEKLQKMYSIYSPKKEKDYGVLGIKIKKIPK